MGEIDPKESFALMLTDFEYLQKSIDKFDAQRFAIKNWAVTSSGAILAVAYGSRRPIVGIGGVLIVLFFGFLEIIYLEMQVSVIERSNQLEGLINRARAEKNSPPEYVFGIGQAFAKSFSFHRVPKLIFRMGRIHITSFYLGLLLAMLLGTFGVLLV
ncbi:hypothetical protein [Planosporangium mesophilum]|uniref:Uncharacterized protein n=1 Tax=Planosporangium mesophilum TaxID=689768 RepID=A0A8J3TGL6_9ACTN|nr:hypothetical protein [Planosporangium mesophilum]NJC86652.1 hypothetical protein [Planosporangium mesophilum]GII25412.1 hypothetical protein Pme01_50090 [Planosporangium mesophilum]